eukprot:GFUD01011983.1.p1 GENE.GFUD01011983.1~~GFUD01011983.1.p1  ORF type:complete len:587 (+),score=118.39 GFUD01011983.1:23-1783(+)
MVKKHKVMKLQGLSLLSVQHLVSDMCFFVAKVVAPQNSKQGLASSDEKQVIVEQFVRELKEYIWSHVAWYLYEDVFDHALEGVIVAVEIMKAEWKLNTAMPEFTLQIWAMVKVAEVLHLKQLKSLDVEKMPKMIRSSVLRNIKDFRGLEKLAFGSSTGDMKGASIYLTICEGIGKMKNLVHFSHKYNCTVDILNALLNAKNTLKVLDMEQSVLIKDDCIPKLIQFENLHELGIAKTKLTTEGQATVIMNLKNLHHLPRGDFICDALEWVAWDEMYEDNQYRNRIETVTKPKLKLQNFWASEVYFFHTTDQMKLVSEMCPDIEDMLFMYQDRYTCELAVLANFHKLKKLELWGGDFYIDNFVSTLENIGPGLVKLDLHHVDNIDFRAISVISFCCQKLKYLRFGGCVLNERNTDNSSENEEEFVYQQQRRVENEIQAHLVPFLDLEELSISNQCPDNLLVNILCLCINIKKLILGMHCQITDQCFDRIFPHNKFQYLEKIEIRKNDLLTMKTLSNILLYCDNIKTILDIEEWSKVDRDDLEELREHMRDNNIDIVLEEKQEDSRGVSLYQICQSALKERYGRVVWDQ